MPSVPVELVDCPGGSVLQCHISVETYVCGKETESNVMLVQLLRYFNW